MIKPLLKFLCQKPETKLLVNCTKLASGEKQCRLLKCAKEQIDSSPEIMADIGTASVYIAQDLKALRAGALEQINNIFGNTPNVTKILNRSKSAVSIEPKLRSAVIKNGVNSYEEAMSQIGDGIGSRVISASLKKVKRKDIMKMIDNVTVNGNPISPQQKELLTKYIYGSKMSKAEEIEAFPLFERFAQPLIEQRSKEVVDKLTLSIAKNRMLKEGLTIEEITKNKLLSPELIKRLSNENIKPLEITEINNYRGMFGLPEFSTRQIQSLRKIAGNKVIIHSRAETAGMGNFPATGYTKEEMKEFAIKASGYRTAQMNVIHTNGALGEIQFRGSLTNEFGECEHIAYDLRQNKNTLGPLFNDFKTAISKLSPKQCEEYNLYLEQYYNYCNRIELGLPAKKPKLPDGLDKILSADSLKGLHRANEKRLKVLSKDFEEHYEQFLTVA